MLKENSTLKDDARFQILAGSFFSSTGLTSQSIARLEAAKELMPTKQQVYFELGAAYINSGENIKALESFKTAYELAPDYKEAKIVYLVGAIYAGDSATEGKMLQEVPPTSIIFDNRILSAYYVSGRRDRATAIVNERIKLDPENESTYREYLNSIAN